NPDRLSSTLQNVTDAAMETMDTEAAETLRTVMNNDIPALSSGHYPESSEYYSLYTGIDFATITDYLPDDGLLIFDELDGLTLAINAIEEKFDHALAEGLSTGRLLPLPRPLHAHFNELTPLFKTKQRAYISNVPPPEIEQGSSMLVEFACRNVERFNNQMP